GVGLWLWLYRTRTGMVIRAGVDDQQMTSALGVNIQKTFAIAFALGSALAAFGAVVWASQANIASGQDGQWLLNSLVVVIVGGMGSIFGAAAGAILYAFVLNFSATYLPTTGADCCTQYSIVVTFALTALFGSAGVILGNLATRGGPGGTSKGLHLGWDPTLALVIAIVLTTAIGLIFGAIAARSVGIYFLMITLTYSVITTYFLGQ